MPKYLLAFHGDAEPPETAEGSAQLIAAWGTWLEGLGDSLLDPGNPALRAKTVSSSGVAEGGGANPLAGYSLIDAPDLDAAIAATEGCPIFDIGGNVEVVELEKFSPGA